MRTKLAALLLAVLLLTGCVPYIAVADHDQHPQTQQMPAPTPAPTAMPQPDSGEPPPDGVRQRRAAD